jgi:presenilin-like A22 family membrane protease
MRGLRSLGLLGLYIGAQLVALALAFPFRAAGLATSGASGGSNSVITPIYLIALIVAAPLVILFVARRRGGMQTIRWLILLGMAVSLTITLDAALALLFPAPVFFPPFGAAQVAAPALTVAVIVAVGLLLALLIEPQWYIVDLSAFLAGGALIAILGISLGILPAVLLLGGLAVYDYIAVYRTKHMLSLADVVVDMKLPILMVMPTGPGYDYTKAGPLGARNAPPGGRGERDALFMGLGDVVIPGTLVASAFVWLPETPLILGVGPNLLVALGTLLGSLVGYAGLMALVNRGNAQAGLPFLNGGAIAGYVLAFLALSPTLGLHFGLY